MVDSLTYLSVLDRKRVQAGTAGAPWVSRSLCGLLKWFLQHGSFRVDYFSLSLFFSFFSFFSVVSGFSCASRI